MAVRPGTLEHDWNRLYAEFPGDYDKFGPFPHQPRHLDVIRRTVPLDGKTVVDVGSGTGARALSWPGLPNVSIGVEPNARMREWAVESATRAGVRNVEFVGGRAEALPFSEAIADVVAAFWTLFWPPEHAVPAFVAEAVRVLRPGGSLLVVDSPPDGDAGDLSHALGVSDVPVHDDARSRARRCGVRTIRRRHAARIRNDGCGCAIVRVHLRPECHRLPPAHRSARDSLADPRASSIARSRNLLIAVHEHRLGLPRRCPRRLAAAAHCRETVAAIS